MEKALDFAEPGAVTASAVAAVDEAILKALAYADIFDSPLTAEEIWRFLALPADSPEVIRIAVTRLARAGVISDERGHYHLPGRDETVPARLERQRASADLWRRARGYVRVLASLPFVRMVAITGSLAANNCDLAADIDVLLVTRPGRLWVAVSLVLGLRRLGVLASPKLCPNYVLSTRALTIAERDLYVAHELARMVPLYGRRVYEDMMRLNGWIAEYLPNARHDLGHPPPERLGWLLSFLKRLLERSLAGRLGDWFDRRARRWLVSRLRPLAEESKGRCVFTADEFRTHYEGHGSRIRLEYAARLRAHGLR
jgi:hypothetical protein